MKQYVVIKSGTNVTVDGRTFTLNTGAIVPDGAEHIEHLLDVNCIALANDQDADLAMSAALTGQPQLDPDHPDFNRAEPKAASRKTPASS